MGAEFGIAVIHRAVMMMTTMMMPLRACRVYDAGIVSLMTRRSRMILGMARNRGVMLIPLARSRARVMSVTLASRVGYGPGVSGGRWELDGGGWN